MLILGVHQMFLIIVIIVLAIFGIGAVGLIVFGIFRLATPERNMHTIATDEFAPSARARVPIQLSDDDEAELEQSRQPPSAAGLAEQLRSMDWFQFEKLVAHVYEKQGYIVSRRGGANPDGGIDLIVQQDEQCTAIQCKQWKAWKVGVKAIREFLGALTDAGIQKGIFITLRGYTAEARQMAEKHGIQIVDEDGLVQMLESTHDIFDPEMLDLLADTRKFCPKCESELVIRVASKGPNPGSRFWGCSTYPRCRFTMPIA